MSVFLLPHTAISMRTVRPVLSKMGPHVKSIASHIQSTGLLNPILVRPLDERHESKLSQGLRVALPRVLGGHGKARYEVVDGFKRLCAILHLKKTGRLPRTLTQIPCTIVSPTSNVSVKPVMLSEAELSQEITRRLTLGETKDTLMAQFECSPDVFNQIISLSFLHPKIKALFNDGCLSLEQAAAFARFPNPKAQWRLIEQIGPFVKSKEILAQIAGPDSIVELPDGEVLILPTRRTYMPDHLAFSPTSAALHIAA